MLESAVICDPGRVRESNEDSVLEQKQLGIWAVADGVGGNGHGDVASQLALQTIERRIRQGQNLLEAVEAANQSILEAIEQNPEFAGMATTLVVSRFEDMHFELAWVGDSRAYFVDSEGISQITADHNVANRLFDSGQIKAEEVASHPGQHELTQALGQMSLPQIPKSLGELHDGDYLLLCSDGLCGVVDDEAMYQAVMASKEPDKAVAQLLELALEAGGPDNISIALIRYHSQETSIHAHEFRSKGRRNRFDRRPYEEHRAQRPFLLGLILIAIVLLIVLL